MESESLIINKMNKRMILEFVCRFFDICVNFDWSFWRFDGIVRFFFKILVGEFCEIGMR